MPAAECLRCGNCCDGDGWVHFTIEERRVLGKAGSVLVRQDAHIPYYSTRYGICPWFDRESRACTIHDKRPRHCRDFEPGGEEARSRGCMA